MQCMMNFLCKEKEAENCFYGDMNMDKKLRLETTSMVLHIMPEF